MIKVFITDRLSSVPDSILLQLMLSNEEYVGGLFQKIQTKNFKNLVDIVNKPEDADYLLMPHNYFSVFKNKKYLKLNESLALKYNKKIIIFAYGDRDKKIKIDNSIVLRTSQYRSKLLKNEIIIPPFVENLDLNNEVKFRDFDLSRKIIIGFAGWVSCSNLVQWIKYKTKIILNFILFKFGVFHSLAILQGLHFRRKVISILNNTNLVDKNFFLRQSYSGHKNTIQDDPDKIRKQFISAIKDSDLALAVRGDGNYSLRFFEILSMGRIPLFIDTDTPLPLENEIDFDSFILRVDFKDLERLPEIINDFWQKNSENNFKDMQKMAKQAFKLRLSPEAFYSYLFNNFNDIVENHEGNIG